MGEDLSKVEVLEEGTSDLTGDYVIEDLEGTDGNFYRRLIFLNNQNLIQSEARLLEPGEDVLVTHNSKLVITTITV